MENNRRNRYRLIEANGGIWRKAPPARPPNPETERIMREILLREVRRRSKLQ